MQAQELYFVIPTYRLRDVGETVEQYDRHFWKNGRTVKIVVFDDSIPANQQKYFPVWSKISNALKRLGFRAHNFLAQLLSETSRACTIRVRDQL
jgi:hypothetical protein